MRQMSPTLTLSGDFEHPDLDSLCDELQRVRRWAPGESARVDLRRLKNMEPTTLAVLLTSLHGLHRRQICNPLEDLDPPQGEGQVECLRPHALNELLVGGSGHWQMIEGDSPAILGCESFAGNRGVDRVRSELCRQLRTHTDWSLSSLKSVGTMIFELSENVIQHSGVSGGVTVLRICPGEQRVSLAIADGGVGIRESLTRNPEFSDIGDDLTAIVKAMRARATGEAGTGGGMGLFLARCVVRSNGGAFMVRSGEACCEESDTRSNAANLPSLLGTLISVEARTSEPFEYDETVATQLGLPAV
jgi:anti-sigma regulatory factor (Ser/Thr protein kinase)/ABC-type transporter Mla MlaB component